jgi:hypothetical protein
MAFEFNGTSSYIETTSTPVTATPFTMACWFLLNTNIQNGTLMHIGNSASTHRFVITTNGTSITFNAIAPTPAAAISPATVANGVWQHAAAVSISTTSRFIYLNGGQKVQSTVSRAPTGLNNISIGATNIAPRQFFLQGRIAEAAIWNTDLTDDEILSLSKGFAPSLVRPTNLKFYNRCIQKSQDLYGGLNFTEVNITNQDHPRIYG